MTTMESINLVQGRINELEALLIKLETGDGPNGWYIRGNTRKENEIKELLRDNYSLLLALKPCTKN